MSFRLALCDHLNKDRGPSNGWLAYTFLQGANFPDYAGKFMGYSAIADPNSEIRPWVQAYFQYETLHQRLLGAIPKKMIRMACNGTESQRSLAASVQAEFAQAVREKARDQNKPRDLGEMQGWTLGRL